MMITTKSSNVGCVVLKDLAASIIGGQIKGRGAILALLIQEIAIITREDTHKKSAGHHLSNLIKTCV